jgi:hypothetical protein
VLTNNQVKPNSNEAFCKPGLYQVLARFPRQRLDYVCGVWGGFWQMLGG